jgi:CBS domain containing-hemolysin-like protein
MTPVVLILVLVFFILASAFFVCAEYALVSVRRTRIEAKAKAGDPAAKRILVALDRQNDYVAGIQAGITFVGIGMGSVLEPEITRLIAPFFTRFLPHTAVEVVSILLVSYPLVVMGELVPKYLTLQFPDQFAAVVVTPLRLIMLVINPFVWLFRTSSQLILRALRIPADTHAQVSREELSLLVQASSEDGALDEEHSDVVAKALRLDQLDAADVMAHRLDVKWLDINTPSEEVLTRLGQIPHSRVPVCDADIDEVVGVVYVHDVIRRLHEPDFTLKSVVRPAVIVPENLTLDRIVRRMQEEKTQIVIVRDEYGGTSGLVTLEDVVEEVFGDLEDSLEKERPDIERTSSRRVSARADVRYDELLEFLEEETPTVADTRTLAQILVDELERVPKLGDAVELPVGKLRVEQVTRHRVVRVGVYLPVKRT